MILMDCQVDTHNLGINLPPMMSCPGFIGGKVYIGCKFELSSLLDSLA